MKLTNELKTTYLNLGLRLLNIDIDNRATELIWRCYDGILKKKGNYGLSDSIEIEIMVNGYYKEKQIKLFESQQKAINYRIKAKFYRRINKL